VISLKSTIEKIKSLETEKKSLILEIDELNRTADAKAIALESEVNALRDEIRSLRILMEESEPINDKRQSNPEPIVNKRQSNPFRRALNWVEDLVVTKTFTGFCFQESILKAISESKHVQYRRSTPEEEARFIDGYIGEMPVSIKPITYKTKGMLHENIDVKLIYYEKLKDGIRVECDF
jgi:hypothetical protein